ncbi:uncharacterized protein LOC101892581 [Musca domestica]|uniref:Uncharacterized protein LOC101892581 n=1 Tax=Musca domestica TaxID=7370 RepID=A0A1I8MP85_MUSDO|nr:uncharacterized protein LOC101892581 [Musca domestica]
MSDSNSLGIGIFILNFLLLTQAKRCSFKTSNNPTCAQLQNIKQSLDATVDPCDNFYGYVCNNWPHAQQNYEDILNYQLNLKLISIMDVIEEEEGEEEKEILNTDFFNKTYHYYRSCLRAKNSDAIASYLHILKPGPDLQWPVLEEVLDRNPNDWRRENFDVYRLLGQLANYGINELFIGSSVAINADGSVILTLKAPFVPHISEEEITNLLAKFQLSPYAITLFTKSFFEILQNQRILILDNDSHRTKHKYLTYQQLGRAYPPLKKFVDNLEIINLRKLKIIAMDQEDYFDFLVGQQWFDNQEPAICTYIMIRMLMYLLRSGKNLGQHQKLDCIDEVRSKLELPTNLLYFAHYRPEELANNAEIKAIYHKLCHIFMENYAKDLRPRPDPGRSCSTTSFNLGNLPNSHMRQRLQRLFSDIPALDLDNFYGNYLHLLRHRYLRDINKHNYPYSVMIIRGIETYLSSPIYDISRNMLAIPFVMLQPPMYDKAYDPLFKLSSMGYQLARNFPQIEHYGLKIMHELPDVWQFETDPESARNVGAAALAYNTYCLDHSSNLQPNFTNTPWQQLFFLNLAQTFCVKARPENSKRIKANEKRLRTIARSLATFNEAFQCGDERNFN